MTVSLAFKPDMHQTRNRFAAWWHGLVLDRPPVTLHVTPRRPYHGPAGDHASARERWLDVEYQVEHAISDMVRRDYLGDAFPHFVPDVGPELAGTLLGCELSFTEDTSWSEPIIHDIRQWAELLEREPDFTGPYWRAIEQMTDLAIERAHGRYLVGVTDLHGAFDTMAALRDPQQLCLDLADDPELIREVSLRLAGVFREAFDRLWARIRAAGMGCTTWAPLYHDGPAYLPSCDFWCMLGPDVARDLVLPSITEEMTGLEHSLFHLDGPDALRHLDLLLALPQLDAVQWVYGAGAGPATRRLDVYRRIIDAGKSVQVIAPAAEALTILEQLGPHGLWLSVTDPFASADEARAYLARVEHLTRHGAAAPCTCRF